MNKSSTRTPVVLCFVVFHKLIRQTVLRIHFADWLAGQKRLIFPCSTLLVFLLTWGLIAQDIPNWPAPPYWSVSTESGVNTKSAGGQPGHPLFAALPTAPVPLIGVTPFRVADTRGNGFTGQYGPPTMGQGTPRNFTLAGIGSIPANAVAVSANITVTQTQGPGFILIYPAGGTAPTVSTLNYVGGQTVANAAVIPLGDGGAATFIAGVSGTELIIDLNGYYAPQASVTLPDTRPVFSRSTIDSTGVVGAFTSATIGTDGLGLISYYDTTNGDLKVAHCNNTACTSATAFTLDNAGDVGLWTSVTIGTDGLGLISYFDRTNGDLKVAHCNNTICSSATPFKLDSEGNVGEYTSVTIGTDGLGLISYYDKTNGNLKAAHCDNTACSSATAFTLESVNTINNAGGYTSVTIGADGLALISYYEFANGDLEVAHCNNTVCSSATPVKLDDIGDVGRWTSVTIGTDGLGLISYYDQTKGALKVAHCDSQICSIPAVVTLDPVLISAGNVGFQTSVTIGTDGLGLISYHDVTNGDLKVAHCNNTACSSAAVARLDITGDVGSYTSVTIGTDGLGLISYWDQTIGDLKVAHLSNIFGLPFVRRR